MTFSLRARMAARSTAGSAKRTPQSARCRASAMVLATCSRAFEGMQPRSRQTPPSRGSRSTSVTFMPRSAARNAAA